MHTGQWWKLFAEGNKIKLKKQTQFAFCTATVETPSLRTELERKTRVFSFCRCFPAHFPKGLAFHFVVGMNETSLAGHPSFSKFVHRRLENRGIFPFFGLLLLAPGPATAATLPIIPSKPFSLPSTPRPHSHIVSPPRLSHRIAILGVLSVLPKKLLLLRNEILPSSLKISLSKEKQEQNNRKICHSNAFRKI